MIYSVHDPIAGGFSYFEFEDGIETNDDQPLPEFPSSKVTPLGVSSLDAGVPLPPGSRLVGRGKLPKGKVSSGKIGLESRAKGGPSVSPDGTAGLGIFENATPTNWAVLVGSAVAAFFLYRRFK